MNILANIKKHLGLEPIEEKLQRFEEIQKAFTESDLQLDELAKDFFIEKSMYEARMKEPDNYIIQPKIQEKFDTFIKGHKESIRKAKKQFDSLKKEKDEIEKAFSNHKYIRKEPDGKGGWNYVYEEEHKSHLTELEKYWLGDIKNLKAEKDKIDIEYNYKRTSLELVDVMSNQMIYPKIEWEDNAIRRGTMQDKDKREGKPIFDKYDIERFLDLHKGRFENMIRSAKETFSDLKQDVSKEEFIKLTKKFNDTLKEYSKWRLESIKIKDPQYQQNYGYDFSKSILGEFGDECISTIEEALKNKKETAYEKIKKAYQHGKISLDSFNTIIKGLTKDEKTKYADFLLFNEEGKLLLLKRSSWEDDNAGAWVIPGGHVDPGEDFKTAAIRELQEESGYNVEDAENVGSYEDDKCHIEYFQAYVNTSEKPIALQFAEVRDYKWVPVNEICEEAMVFNMRDNVLKILGIEDQDKHKKIIRKAILAGIVPIEMVIKKAKDIKESGFYQNNQDKYKQKLERLEARRTDKQYTKEEADYVDNFVDGDHQEENSCDRCGYYRPKQEDDCLKVIGGVSHNGHCKFWEHSDTDKSLQMDIEKAYLAGLISDDLIEKAWKKQPVGTVTTRKDGQQYKKVAETGNMDQDWRLVTKDKDQSEKPESKGNKQSKEVKGGDKPIDSKELEIHAKNASESTLQAAIKESADENVRTAAHNELDRREKEEKPKEDADEGGAKGKEKQGENKFIKQFRDLSDKQLEFYLNAPDKEVSGAAEEILKERDIDFIKKVDFDKMMNFISESKTSINTISKSVGGSSDYETVKNLYNFLGGVDNIGKIDFLDISPSNRDLSVALQTDILSMERVYDHTTQTVTNLSFQINKKGTGLGAKIFDKQIKSYAEQGYKKAETRAVKSEISNGYYTWARLGYSFDNDQDKNAFQKLINESDNDGIKSVNSLTELMTFKEGRDFWNKNGFGFNAEFDLSKDSESMFILNKYMEDKNEK